MSNSKLATWNWNGTTSNYNKRDHKIDTITPHHQAGNGSLQSCCDHLASNGGSANYIINSAGVIGVMIDEELRAWTSSNRANDMRAVTIEVANDGGAPDWHVSDKALAALIDLCTDICKRNGIERLNFTGDKSGNLTMHKWFAATACPGPYLESKFPYIADEVNKRLNANVNPAPAPTTIYRVQTGAYSKKDNATALADKLKKAGFDTYLVQSDGYYKVQVGAYANRDNANAMAAKLKAAGYDTFITTKGGTAVSNEAPKKTVDELAREVIAGKWGNGDDRKRRLEAAGYDYSAVQKRVNEIMK